MSEPSNITAIKRAVAARAAELGAQIRAHDVTLDWLAGEAAPGCRVFRARWGAGQQPGALAGLVCDDGPPDLLPAQALSSVFGRWLERTGAPPEPTLLATVAAVLYDAAAVHTPILSQAERTMLIERPEWRARVQLPTAIERAGQPGVEFWWVGRGGLSRVRISRTAEGRIDSQETSIREVLAEDAAP